MAGNNGPKIITSNLVRCWDAADFKYSQSSWVDLAGSGDSVSSTGGYGTSSNFGGYWSFNGSFHYVTMTKSMFPAVNSGPRTLEVWMNSRQSNSLDTNYRGMIQIGTSEAGYGFNMAFRGTTELGFNRGNGTLAGDTTWQTISQGIYDRWILFTLTYASSTLNWYINGSLIYSQTISLLSGATEASNRISIAGYVNNAAVWIGAIRFYNNNLSASQVLNNYNATKGRFGL